MRDFLLKEVAQVVDCEHKTAPRADDCDAFGYSVGTTSLKGGRIDYASAKPVSMATWAAWSKRAELGAGDLILAREAPVGQVGYVSGKQAVCLGQRTVLLRPDDVLVDGRYLHYRLLAPAAQEWMRTRSEGSTVVHLNVADVRMIPLPSVPSLLEQRAIADVLSHLDDLIDTNLALAASCEELARAIAWSAPARRSLDLMAGPLTTSAVPTGVVDHYSLPAFDERQLPDRVDGATIKSRKVLITSPSALVSRLNPHIPRVWMAYPESPIPAMASTEFVSLIGHGVPTEFVWAACSGEEFMAQMRSLVTGTTGSHQRVDKTALLTLEVPDHDALTEVQISTVRDVVRQAFQSRVEAGDLRRTRDELLPLLMSGAVSVGEVAA